MDDIDMKKALGCQYRYMKQRQMENQNTVGGNMNEGNTSLVLTNSLVFSSSEKSQSQKTSDTNDQNTTGNVEEIVRTNGEVIGSSNAPSEENVLLSDDPGTWPERLSSKNIEKLMLRKPIQVTNYDFPLNEMNDKFSVTFYYSKPFVRRWLLYSITRDSVYCLYCKIFNKKHKSLFITGCKDWRNLLGLISEHESCFCHSSSYRIWSRFKSFLEQGIFINCAQQQVFELEKERWSGVMRRFLCIVLYLSRQNLTLVINNPLKYSNFLKVLKMIAKFDSVMSDHLKRVEQSKCYDSKLVQYVGNVQNKCISLISDVIKSKIIGNINESKYYSVILNCTPDVRQTKKLTLMVRFLKKNEPTICEHFLGFVPIESTGKKQSECLLNVLSELKLNIKNLRGQSFDYLANVKEELDEIELQVNRRAFFVPSYAHSLNNVVIDAAKTTFEIIDFFNVVRELYVFFSASTKMWNILKNNLPNFKTQPLPETRWETELEFISPLKYHLGEIYDSLWEIFENETEDINTRAVAQTLCKKIQSFKFICSVQIWYIILSRINPLSKMFQESNINMGNALENIQYLIECFKTMRSDEIFLNIITESKNISADINGDTTFPIEPRLRKRKTNVDRETVDEPVIIDPQNSFKYNFYYSILDSTLSLLKIRFELLRSNSDIFFMFYSIKDLLEMEECFLLRNCKMLQFHLTNNDCSESDINGDEMFEEIKMLKTILTLEYNAHDVLKAIYSFGLSDLAPNLCTALRIFLTMPVVVGSGKRFFSKSKIVENCLRSYANDERLNDLSIISVEHELCCDIDEKLLIDKYATEKALRISSI